jgi:putative transcriptional regulator
MTIRHHPPDDLMLGLAAGRLRPAMALALQVHVDGCPTCRTRLAGLEAVGGVLLDEAEPEALATDALARAMKAIDAPAAPAPRVPASPPLPMPPGALWPRALGRCRLTRWRWMAPGMRYAKATLPEDPQTPLFLLRIAPGMSLARHTHGRLEFTQVLCGAFDDGRSVFGAGDFDLADPEVHHQPQVLPGGDCVCLAYVEHGLRYDGRLAGMVGRWIGL